MALTTSDHMAQHAEKQRRRAVVYTRINDVVEKGGDPRTDELWGEFEEICSNGVPTMLARFKDLEARKAVNAFVDECTKPLDRNQGTLILQQRTNQLLGAILLKLHGIER